MKFKKILSSLSIILALSAFATISFPDDSEARRFGSRRSIGRTVTPKASPPAGSSMTQQRQQPNQSAAAAGGGAAAMNRGGMFGGMFGGLLAGTLIGSLLMGGGMGAGAGGFLDIILLGALGFFAYRFFKSRSNNANNNSNRNTQQNHNYQRAKNQNQEQDSNSAWDHLRSEPSTQDEQTINTQTNSDIPQDFDSENFLVGAKALYIRMQESWDNRDLDDIVEFITPNLFGEIKKQYEEDLSPSKTEILLLEASIYAVNQTEDDEQVSVLFDVLMREDQSSENTEQVKEIWNFTKPKNNTASWKLDGIQQV